MDMFLNERDGVFQQTVCRFATTNQPFFSAVCAFCNFLRAAWCLRRVWEEVDVFGKSYDDFGGGVEFNTWIQHVWMDNNKWNLFVMPLPLLDGTAERRPTQYITCARQTVAGEQLASLCFPLWKRADSEFSGAVFCFLKRSTRWDRPPTTRDATHAASGCN